MSARRSIVDGKVIVQPGGRGASMVAYDVKTGQAVWKALDDMQAYVSPMLVTLAGRRQIVTMTADRVVGLASRRRRAAVVASLDQRQRHQRRAADRRSDRTAALPLVRLRQGRGGDRDRPRRATGFRATEVWQTPRMKNRLSSSVLLDGYVYGLDEGILAASRPPPAGSPGRTAATVTARSLLAGDRLRDHDRDAASSRSSTRRPRPSRSWRWCRASTAAPGTCRRSTTASCSSATRRRWPLSTCADAGC